MIPAPQASMPGLSAAISVLSAMITPAVLILASSSLILTTSNRLSLVLGRVRSLAAHLEALVSGEEEAVFPGQKRELVIDQIDYSARRVGLLQRALSGLYFALAVLTATSVLLGVDAALGQEHASILVPMGIAGVLLLFYVSILLILESRVAHSAVRRELLYVKRLADEQNAPPRRLPGS